MQKYFVYHFFTYILSDSFILSSTHSLIPSFPHSLLPYRFDQCSLLHDVSGVELVQYLQVL
jgi:hypothetical protein